MVRYHHRRRRRQHRFRHQNLHRHIFITIFFNVVVIDLFYKTSCGVCFERAAVGPYNRWLAAVNNWSRQIVVRDNGCASGWKFTDDGSCVYQLPLIYMSYTVLQGPSLPRSSYGTALV